jgi:hypothetical protein
MSKKQKEYSLGEPLQMVGFSSDGSADFQARISNSSGECICIVVGSTLEQAAQRSKGILTILNVVNEL